MKKLIIIKKNFFDLIKKITIQLIDSYKDNEFRNCEFSRLWVSCGGFDFRDFVVDPISHDNTLYINYYTIIYSFRASITKEFIFSFIRSIDHPKNLTHVTSHFWGTTYLPITWKCLQITYDRHK